MKLLPVLTIAIASLLLLTGFTVIAMDDQAQASVLTRFSSENELRSFIIGHASNDRGSNDMLALGAAESASFSRTNAQVQGVDEGDLVKTDGKTIFIAEGRNVHLIGTEPELTNITYFPVGNISQEEQATIQALYLWGGYLIVVCTIYEHRSAQPEPLWSGMALMYYPYLSDQRTEVLVYSLDEPHDPKLVRSGGISGSVVTTRLIDGTLYLVAEQSVWNGQDIQLPQRSSNGTTGSVEATAISYDPGCPEISSYVNLLAFDAPSGRMSSLTVLSGPTSVVYMSETSLYLTMDHWSRSGGMFDASSKATTSIYRMAVDGTDLTLAAQGKVDGTPLNQFALDERAGRLRVATTASGPEPTSSVHMLDLDLKNVGLLDGIAPGERIYSCRYLEDRLYLVTFRQVDPLFAIDLSTDAPAVLGELKVPGASTYLQMVDDGLLGIGFENGSVKVSLYNVSDPGDLRETGSYVVEGFSHSAAQYDHHAVLYNPVHRLLVIPLTYYGSWTTDSWTYYRPWSVALAVSIGAHGIAPVGEIEHDNATVERSLYIGEVLYTISDTTVKAASLPSLAPMGQLTYSEGRHYYGWYGAAEPVMVK